MAVRVLRTLAPRVAQRAPGASRALLSTRKAVIDFAGLRRHVLAPLLVRCLHSTPPRLAVGPPESFTIGPDGSKIVAFRLADIGEGIAECELMKWFVKVGDTVQQFDKVCEVQSDKATVEISSRYDGVVKTLEYKVGEVAKVGSPLMTIQLAASDPHAAAAATAAAAAPAASSSAAPAPQGGDAPAAGAGGSHVLQDDNGKILTTPSVRRIARENNINLALVPPTGPKGRLLKEDVLKFLEQGGSASGARAAAPPSQAAAPRPAAPAMQAARPAPTQPAPAGAKPAAEPAAAAAAPAAAPRVVQSREDRKEPITGIQRVMVKTMTAANNVPTLLYCDDVYMDELSHVREQLKKQAEHAGVKLSFLPFIIKATSMALVHFPRLNMLTNSDCTEVIIKGSHNIGIAMDTPRGLLVPNIKNVQDLSILDIARELGRLQALGMAGKLGQDDLGGGTFTLSNIGSVGGTYAKPILVVPQVMIGALGKIQTLPRFDDKMQVRAAKVMCVSWTADHRVIEGALVAHFCNKFKHYLEKPSAMMLDMR